MRSAELLELASALTPGASTVISSPPQRATTSEGRSPSVSRRTTSISTSSPTPWPKRSFTDLNRSRSTTNSPAGTRAAHDARVLGDHRLLEGSPVRSAGELVTARVRLLR